MPSPEPSPVRSGRTRRLSLPLLSITLLAGVHEFLRFHIALRNLRVKPARRDPADTRAGMHQTPIGQAVTAY